jgi:hypothetical protein
MIAGDGEWGRPRLFVGRFSRRLWNGYVRLPAKWLFFHAGAETGKTTCVSWPSILFEMCRFVPSSLN